MSSRVRLFVYCAVLFLGTFALFSRTVEFGFLDYDDPDFVTQNGIVRGGFTWPGVRAAFTSGGPAANWQPVTWLSLMLDAEFAGMNPAAFHLTNVLWHSANAVLAFLLFARFTRSRLAAFWAAALFAWHPLRVESVAWIAERKDVVSVCFALLTLLAYLRYQEQRSSGRRTTAAYYIVALACFVAGLLAKPSLVSLPLILVLVDALPVTTAVVHGQPRTWLEKMPFFASAAACAIVTVIVQHGGGALDGAPSWQHRVLNAPVSIVRYLANSAWPTGLATAYPQRLDLSPLVSLGAIAIVTAVTLQAVRFRRTAPLATFGWLWFLVALVPMLGLIQAGPQAMADRYTYFPSIGLELVVLGAVAALAIGPVRRAIVAAAAIIVLFVSVAITHADLPYWRSSDALFARALAVTKNNYIAETCRATTALNHGDVVRAAAGYRAALDIKPDYAPASYGLGATLERLGRFEEAATAYEHAIHDGPHSVKAYVQLGRVRLHQHRANQAAQAFSSAELLQPEVAAHVVGHARALALLGKITEAEVLYQRAVAMPSADAAAWDHYAEFAEQGGRTSLAQQCYTAAVRAEPHSADAHFNAGNFLERHERWSDALTEYRTAYTLNSIDGDCASAIAAMLMKLEQWQPAQFACQRALALRANNAETRFDLGATLLRQGRTSEAIEQFQRVLLLQPDFAPARDALAACGAPAN